MSVDLITTFFLRKFCKSWLNITSDALCILPLFLFQQDYLLSFCASTYLIVLSFHSFSSELKKYISLTMDGDLLDLLSNFPHAYVLVLSPLLTEFQSCCLLWQFHQRKLFQPSGLFHWSSPVPPIHFLHLLSSLMHQLPWLYYIKQPFLSYKTLIISLIAFIVIFIWWLFLSNTIR